MTLHKLTAGSGYDYLTRQVAALDATDKGHTGLSTYYSERGEAPGRWVGSGLSGLNGIEVGDRVTGEQMSNLFAFGYHPLYDPTWEPTTREAVRTDREMVWKLGRPYPIHAHDVTPFRIELARRVAALDEQAPGGVPADVRARLRTETAVEFFTAEHGRAPASERELHGFIARNTRPRTDGVSGYDLTFSPVKSVSTLWAVADPTTAAAVERAHDAAVQDALGFIEKHALFSRTGAGGARQVEVTGLVATAFTHRDSRAGDPDLHTHVALANKVQTRTSHDAPGRWLSIDGRVLFKAKVAASETYNTRLEHHLTQALGVRFAERDNPGPGPRAGHAARGGKRTVREIVGIDPDLNARWSQRRSQITARQGDLAAQFRRDHQRPPTPVEALHLAQQANLETRDKKHSARTTNEQRDTWQAQAAEVIGSTEAVRRMVDSALSPTPGTKSNLSEAVVIDSAWIDSTAARVIDELEQRRATWQTWHVRAEAQRQIRAADLTAAADETGPLVASADLVDQVIAAALAGHSVSLAGPRDSDHSVVEPAALRRSDGTSVYTVAGTEQFTSTSIIAAEQRLLAHARSLPTNAMVVPDMLVEMALLEATANGTPLNLAQATLVHDMATSGQALQLAIAPAGSGKTTALRALASAWAESGGTVVALAPSAAAVAEMTAVLDRVPRVHADTLAKLVHTLDTAQNRAPAQQNSGWVDAIDHATLVLIDEAGMADTLTLDQVVSHVTGRGGQVRLIGDDQQLSAIAAGGILRDIKTQAGAIHLTELLRFADPDEARATIALREGDPDALRFYETHDRIHIGDQHSIADTLRTAWNRDRHNGLDALMVAPTRDHVADLNRRAQATLFPDPDRPTITISDGNRAGIDDLVITRTNNRRLRLASTDWVKNGDRWHVTHLDTDGSLHVRHHTSGLTTRLPADYVAASVELGYATTIHTAQGTTVDTVHALATGTETRQDLYTMLTRGRHHNDIYFAAAATTGDPHELITPDATHPQTAHEILTAILDRDGSAVSATTEHQRAHDPATLFRQAVDRYADALTVAAEDVVGTATVNAIEDHAAAMATNIDQSPAWPTLRSRLISLEIDGHHATDLLDEAAARGQLANATDPAAVLTWRIETLTDLASERDGPHRVGPRTPVPQRLLDHPEWGTYLQARQQFAQHYFAQLLAEPTAEPGPANNHASRRTPSPPSIQTAHLTRSRAPMR